MKNVNLQGIMMGAGLAGITVLAGTLALAAPNPNVKAARKDVKEARKEVRHETKDLHRADTPAQRRDARSDLRAAHRDLRHEQQDLQRERLQRERLQRERLERERLDRERRVHETRNRSSWNKRNWHKGNIGNWNHHPANRALDGVVVYDTRGNSFTLRTSGGRNIRVQVQGGEPRRISRGDYVRVYGFSSGSIFHAQSVSILRNR